MRVLLIGESAPDDGGDSANRRFFSGDRLTGNDNLFRAVVAAALGISKLSTKTVTSKRPYLERLREQGYFLIDLVPYPVNTFAPAERKRALHNSAAGCAARAKALQPDGIIVCHSPSFTALRGHLLAAGLPLLHDEAIPFPLGNWRTAFVEKVQSAPARLESPLPSLPDGRGPDRPPLA